jgi:hypothetical protein
VPQRVQREVVGDREAALERRPVEQETDAPRVPRDTRRRIAEDSRLAGVQREQPEADAKRGRLAGAARPDEADDRAARDAQVDAVERGAAAPALRRAAQLERDLPFGRQNPRPIIPSQSSSFGTSR